MCPSMPLASNPDPHTPLHSTPHHSTPRQAKVAKRTEELAALQAELEAAKAETAGLREQVAAQELSPADVQRMCQERARLEEVRCS